MTESPLELIQSAALCGLEICFDGESLSLRQVDQTNTTNPFSRYPWQMFAWEERMKNAETALIAIFQYAEELTAVEIPPQKPVEATQAPTCCEVLLNDKNSPEVACRPLEFNSEEARRLTPLQVQDWLKSFLADGSLKASEVSQAASQVGITPKSLRNARERLNIKPIKVAEGWLWSLSVLAATE